MKQRGRKSAASLAVVSVDQGGYSVIGPPPGLTDGERAVWMASASGKPSDWFGSEHIAMLVDYCRTVVRCDVLDAQIKAFDPEWLKEDEGLKRYERLLSMAAKLSGVCNTLARSMRLTHQSKYVANKAGTTVRGRKPWQDVEAEE
jgi:hypothetical protein